MIQLARPCRGHITQPYGNIQSDGNPHTGNDYAYTDGTNIYPEVFAAADGVVVFVGDSRSLGWPNAWYFNPHFDRSDAWDSSAGNVVVLRHRQGNTTFDTTYSHLESWNVKVGDPVRAFQRVATIGNTGNSYGKHLHFELLVHPFNFGTATYGRSDPNPYIGKLAAASAPPEEDSLSAEDVTELKNHFNMALYGGPPTKEQLRAPLWKVAVENQKRIGLVPAKAAAAVWGTTVKRATGRLSVLQDLVNGVSSILRIEPTVVQIAQDTADDIAATIPDDLAQQVVDALSARLNGGK